MKNRSFYLMLLGMGLGIGSGLIVPTVMLKLAWLGEIFINMLKLICLPLIFSALVSAIASIGNMQRLGKIGKYTLAYVLTSVSVAVLIGLLLINLLQPGIGIDPKVITSGHYQVNTNASFTLVTFIQGLFPDNIIAAAAKFQIMPVVIYAVVFAIACITCGEKASPVVEFFSMLREIFIKMINWLMHLTPIGLFSLLGAATAHAVQDKVLLTSLKGLGLFIALFLTGLILQMLWQGIVMRILTRIALKKTANAVAPALMTAFATASSMATLPVALTSAQKLGLSPQTIRFVLPLATTINLSGTAMYEAVAAVFFSQILGIPLTFWDQLGIFFIAIIAGMGATGIPEGGLVTMVSVLSAVNVPTSAIGLLLPFDRILDRCRTMVNVWSDLMCTTVVNYFLNKKTETVLTPATAKIPCSNG
jgi:Na+/H+-dicarboxylate symporter